MSEQNTTETPTEDTPGAPVTPVEPSGNQEAAKYRHQLRKVEAERDQLKDSLVQYQKDEISRAVGSPISLSFSPEEQRQGLTGSPGMHVSEQVNGKIIPKNQVLPMTLKHPEDLFTIGGAKPEDLIEATGKINAAAVEASLKNLYAKRPDLFKLEPQPVPTIGTNPGRFPAQVSTWHTMLKEAANK